MQSSSSCAGARKVVTGKQQRKKKKEELTLVTKMGNEGRMFYRLALNVIVKMISGL